MLMQSELDELLPLNHGKKEKIYHSIGDNGYYEDSSFFNGSIGKLLDYKMHLVC